MANTSNEENWAARERLRRVEFLLWWRGWVGRGDLTEGFGISAAQASGDLQRYAELNPGAMIYHTSRKRYESVPEMVCRLHEASLEEAVRVFLGGSGVLTGWGRGQPDAGDVRLAVLTLPERKVDPAVARRALVALLEKKWLRVRYASLNSGKSEWRRLVPGALAWDGHRWHVRAWCAERGEWRDFVLGRMSAAEWPAEVVEQVPEDKDWETLDTVSLKLNPKLTQERRDALRMDYGLAGETLELRVRRAMKPYLLANLFIDAENHRELPRHFVVK